MRRNTDKTYTATKEVNGVTYRAQFNGVREAARAIEEYSKNELAFDEYLLENVIVDPPHLKIDDFDSYDEFKRVVIFAANVLTGRFRNTTDESGTETSGGGTLAAVETGAE